MREVRKAIMQEFREFKMSIRKNEYPIELKQIVHLISNGYVDMVK